MERTDEPNTGGRGRPGRLVLWLLLMVLAAAGTLAHQQPAAASVMPIDKAWPTDADGYSIVNVCIIYTSTTEQRNGGLPHASNPGLDEVIAHVRQAISYSWEQGSSLRFRDWRPCLELTPAEHADAVGLYIDPTAGNHSKVGADARGHSRSGDFAISFKPWGNGADCIEYDAADARMEYSFECVEQYAIHEFGHLLGIEHEWRHPLAPSECPVDGEPSIANTVHTATLPAPAGKTYLIVNPGYYDLDSIMVYGGETCAHTTGRRFGSERPNATDMLGVYTMYPPVPRGRFDIGVLATEECNSGVAIRMDDEDDENASYEEGWTGRSGVDGNTSFELCRMDGSLFGKPLSGGYAVVKLGDECPDGSLWYQRYFDNEDGVNANYISGDIYPNTQTTSGTWLNLCYFGADNPGGHFMGAFPNAPADYGVFAAASFPLAVETGTIHTDDEDDDNENELRVPVAPDSIHQEFAGLLGAGENTTLRLARVARDTTGPVIEAVIEGTLGEDGWYTSDVDVHWQIAEESTVLTVPCADETVTVDGTTAVRCTMTSAGGTTTEGVTIKRDTTAPTIAMDSVTPSPTNGWYASEVTVGWTCTDATSGVDQAAVEDVLGGDGADQVAHGTCTDRAGLTASDHRGGFDVDATPPVIVRTGRFPSANVAGWNRTDVTVSWSCTDALSGIPSGGSTVATTITGEGAVRAASATCTDVAGNTESDTVVASIDRTPPTAVVRSRTATNANGWNRTSVAVLWECSDPLSGPAAGFVQDIVATEGVDQEAQSTCADLAGNERIVSEGGIDIDLTAPSIAFVGQSPAANANGWNTTDVDLSWACDDALSGPAAATATATITTEGTDQQAEGTCSDLAGNTRSSTDGDVDLDRTAPSIHVAGQTPAANDRGWNSTDVTVSWTCTDGTGSGIDDEASSTSHTFTAEGADQTALGACVDLAGNRSSTGSSSVNIDRTAPTATIGHSNGVLLVQLLGLLRGTLDGTATDSVSGVAEVHAVLTNLANGRQVHPPVALRCDATGSRCTWSVRPGAVVGRFRLQVTAVDRAGHHTTAVLPTVYIL